jgi:hypothetical protein
VISVIYTWNHACLVGCKIEKGKGLKMNAEQQSMRNNARKSLLGKTASLRFAQFVNQPDKHAWNIWKSFVQWISIQLILMFLDISRSAVKSYANFEG